MPDNNPVPFTMPFAQTLEIEIDNASNNEVIGRMQVRDALCTTGDRLHGGAIMAFADNLGAIGAFLNVPEGSVGTTTLESKTNFVGAAKMGDIVTGTATPVHIGRRTSVWQTKITSSAGKLVAVVTQTQMVL